MPERAAVRRMEQADGGQLLRKGHGEQLHNAKPAGPLVREQADREGKGPHRRLQQRDWGGDGVS